MEYKQLIKEKIDKYIKESNVKELEKIIKLASKELNQKKCDFDSNYINKDININKLMNDKFWNYDNKDEENLKEIEKYTFSDYMEAMEQTIAQWDYYVRLSIVKEKDTPKEALEILLNDSSKKIRELAAVRLWVETPTQISKSKYEKKSELIIDDDINEENLIIKDCKNKKTSETNKIINSISNINNILREIHKRFYYYPDDISSQEAFNHFMVLFFETFNDISIQEKDSDSFIEKIKTLKESYIDNHKLNDILWINFKEQIQELWEALKELKQNIKTRS